MSTRGFIGFAINGEEKIAYNHFDSYPEGLGEAVLNWAINVDDWERVKQLVRSLKLVDDSTPPTQEQIAQLRAWTSLGVGEQSQADWYCLLRGTQGDPAAILAAGYTEAAHHFPLDSLFCEWGYLVDLDAGLLEVYVGFQKESHADGRFAERWREDPDHGHHYVLREQNPNHSNPGVCFRCDAKVGEPEFEVHCPEGYYPVRLLKSYPLGELRAPDEFSRELNLLAYPEQEEE